MKGENNMKKLKTVLMWYSGFAAAIYTALMIAGINDTSSYAPTIEENITGLILWLPLFFYVSWEIYDNLKEI